MSESDGKVKFVVPVLKPRLFCGLSKDVKGNAHFVDDSTVIHPVGRVIVVDDLTDASQDYIKIPVTHKVVNIVAISPNRRYIAIGESGMKPSVSVFNLATKKRMKLLGNPIAGCSGKAFEVITFTHDSQYLIAVVGEPDWLLIYYNWQKGKVESTLRAVYATNPTNIMEVACNPKDRSVCALIGNGLFRLMSCLDNVWRQFGFQRAENLPMTGACWVTSEMILVGTEDGRLVLIESADLRGIFKSYDLNEIIIKPKLPEAEGRQNQISLASNTLTEMERSGVYRVRGLISFSKGFAYSCTSGIVNVFEKTGPLSWVRKNVIDVCGTALGTLNLSEMDRIHSISISPNESKMLITTSRTDIYYGAILTEQDLSKVPKIKFKILFNGFHQGAIGTVSVCLWKPLFLTVGLMDRTCRIWNHKTGSLVLIKEFPDEIYSAAFHPSGFYCLLGFTDKLKLLMILIDDMKPIRHVDIKGCTLVEFSRGGHLFAAVNGVAVEVYCAITFQNICVLTGHLGPIKALHFVKDDMYLYTCGQEGSLYKWDLRSRERIEDIFTKNCGNYDIAAKNNGDFVYTVGSDGTLKEITNGEITREVNMNQYSLFSVVMSNSNQLMFMGGEKGTVVSIVYPLVYPPAFREFAMHTKTITKIAITCDDEAVISVSEEGALCLWDIRKAEGKKLDMINGFSHLTEVILDIDEWNKRLEEIGELRTRMAEIEGEHSYIVRQVTAAHEAALREVHGGYLQTIEDLKARIKQMEREHLLEIHNYHTKLEDALSSHGNEIEKKEREYAGKLIQEYDRYDLLVKQKDEDESNFKKKISAIKKASVIAIADLENQNQMTMSEKNGVIQELRDQVERMVAENAKYKQMVEEDCEMEIEELQAKFDKELKEKNNRIEVLFNENGLLLQRSKMLEDEIDQLKSKVKTLVDKENELSGTIGALTKEIDLLKAEIDERDWTIARKDELVVKLTQRSEKAIKENSVRDVRLECLKLQMEPKILENEQLNQKISRLEVEIQGLYKSVNMKNFHIAHIKRRTKVLERETRRRQREKENVEKCMQKLLYELYMMSKVVHEPKELQVSVTNLLVKYLTDSKKEIAKQDEDVIHEFRAQRSYLETIIQTLKNKLFRKNTVVVGKTDYSRQCVKRLKGMTDEIQKLNKIIEFERERIKFLERRLVKGDDVQCVLNGTTYGVLRSGKLKPGRKTIGKAVNKNESQTSLIRLLIGELERVTGAPIMEYMEYSGKRIGKDVYADIKKIVNHISKEQ